MALAVVQSKGVAAGSASSQPTTDWTSPPTDDNLLVAFSYQRNNNAAGTAEPGPVMPVAINGWSLLYWKQQREWNIAVYFKYALSSVQVEAFDASSTNLEWSAETWEISGVTGYFWQDFQTITLNDEDKSGLGGGSNYALGSLTTSTNTSLVLCSFNGQSGASLALDWSGNTGWTQDAAQNGTGNNAFANRSFAAGGHRTVTGGATVSSTTVVTGASISARTGGYIELGRNSTGVVAALLDSGVPTSALTGSIAGTVLTVTAITGFLSVGTFVYGAGVTANTYIASYGTGVGGTGTYNLSQSSTVSSEALTTLRGFPLPADFSLSNTVRTLGAGGGAGVHTDGGLNGGGAGAYSSATNVSATGAYAPYMVGASGTPGTSSGGAGTDGGDTWFNGANLGASGVGAKGGEGGYAGGAAGGAASSGVGSVKHNGGTGGAGTAGASGAASGGAAGGPQGDGGNGVRAASGFNGSGGGGSGGGGSGTNGANGVAGDSTGNGGNNAAGVGGAAGGVNFPSAGTLGGGGGGALQNSTVETAGGFGGTGADFTLTAGGPIGAGGGGGSSGGRGNGGAGGNFGGGAGAGNDEITSGNRTGGAGATGAIILAFTPVSIISPPPGDLVFAGETPSTLNPPAPNPAAGHMVFVGASDSPTITPVSRIVTSPGHLVFDGIAPAAIDLATPPFDWRATVISQYQASPVILQIVANLASYIDPGPQLDAFFNLIWNVETAEGIGLDIWGRIVGCSRIIEVPSAGSYLGFEEAGDPDRTPWGQAPWFRGDTASSAFPLTDDAFRLLIFAKALANITDGSIPGLNSILLTLFPGRGDAFVTDGGDMTMTYEFEFPLTPVELAIVSSAGILPTPAGVTATVVQS
jgi:hypothetical protein